MSITPGTWKVMRYFDCNSHPRYNIIVEGTETVIAKEIVGIDNALAISKVPQMIEALKRVAPYVSQCEYDIEWADGGEAEYTLNLIQDILHKIEGGSQND